MQIDRASFCVASDELLLIPAHTFYRPLGSKGCTYYFLHFSAFRVEEEPRPEHIRMMKHAGINEPDFAYNCSSEHGSIVSLETHMHRELPELRRIFDKAAELAPGRSFSDKLMLDARLRELLILISSRDETKYSRNLSAILDYIDRSYSEPISLSSLSRRFELSESYISRIFRNELGQRPSEYITKARITAASSLLIHSDLGISEIAERVGYSDVYYFSRCFKRICGISPTGFRNGQ